MRFGKIAIILCVSVIVIACALVFANKAIQAQGEGSDASVSQKLDELLSGQKTILAEISAIKEELKIIKIRVTQSQ